jgi:hypothetical protein
MDAELHASTRRAPCPRACCTCLTSAHQ